MIIQLQYFSAVCGLVYVVGPLPLAKTILTNYILVVVSDALVVVYTIVIVRLPFVARKLTKYSFP